MDYLTLKRYAVRWRGLAAIVAAAAALVALANAFGWVQIFEWATLDRWFRLRPLAPVDTRMVIVTIDEPDMSALNRWPMSDRTMVQMLRNISAQQPKVIGLDIYRNLGPDNPESELSEVFRNTPNLIGIEKVGGNIIPPPAALKAAKRIAAVDKVLDADGKLRRALLGIERKDGSFVEGFGAKMALVYLEDQNVSSEIVDEARGTYRLGKATFSSLRGDEGGYIGSDGGGYQILLDFRGQLDRFLHVSLSDVLANRIEPGLMRDRIVLIGAIAPSLNDLFLTPYSSVPQESPRPMPGVVVHANLIRQIIEAALEGHPLLEAPGRIANHLSILLGSAIGAIGTWCLLQAFPRRNRFLAITLSYLVLTGSAFCAISYYAFLRGWMLPYLSPWLALGSATILTTNYHNRQQLRRVNQRLERANQRLEQYSRTLELKVAERTRELSATLENLQATQNELIQKEKMAALGQLVAGVAHEVNSPLGAIRSSIGNIANFLDRDLEQLPAFFHNLSPEQQQNFFSLLHQSQRRIDSILSSREMRQLRRRFTQQLETAGIDNARHLADTLVEIGIADSLEPVMPLLAASDHQTLLDAVYRWASVRKSAQTIINAADRAAKVVFALKTYARYDHSGAKIKVDVISGVETVLALYHTQLNQEIEILREYEEDLPALLCYPDELNQVWTNLVHNAFQAMGHQGKLHVKIERVEEEIEVAITDSGRGIDPEIQDKIFLPFFTTKSPGEGSGLGLDIAQKIVEKHQGTISFSSVPGRTTFSVRLPAIAKS